MTDVSFIECSECGLVGMSWKQERIIEEGERHSRRHPDHDLYLHVMESKSSRQL